MSESFLWAWHLTKCDAQTLVNQTRHWINWTITGCLGVSIRQGLFTSEGRLKQTWQAGVYLSEAVYEIVSLRYEISSATFFSALTDWTTTLKGRIGRLKVVVPKLFKNWQVESVDLHPVVGATVVVEGSVVGGASLVCITWPPPPLIPDKRKLIDSSEN